MEGVLSAVTREGGSKIIKVHKWFCSDCAQVENVELTKRKLFIAHQSQVPTMKMELWIYESAFLTMVFISRNPFTKISRLDSSYLTNQN